MREAHGRVHGVAQLLLAAQHVEYRLAQHLRRMTGRSCADDAKGVSDKCVVAYQDAILTFRPICQIIVASTRATGIVF